MPPTMTPFRFINVEQQAEALLAAARARAAELLRQAIHEAEKLREQARAEGAAVGRQEGLRQGLEEGRARGLSEERSKAEAALPETARTLAALAGAFADERRALHLAAERDLLRLACAVAARVVKAEIARDPGAVRRNVEAAVALAAGRRRLVLRVHPGDADTLRTYLPALQKAFTDVEGLELAADPAVARGGCRVESVVGDVDAQIETQLAQIETALLGDENTGKA